MHFPSNEGLEVKIIIQYWLLKFTIISFLVNLNYQMIAKLITSKSWEVTTSEFGIKENSKSKTNKVLLGQS